MRAVRDGSIADPAPAADLPGSPQVKLFLAETVMLEKRKSGPERSGAVWPNRCRGCALDRMGFNNSIVRGFHGAFERPRAPRRLWPSEEVRRQRSLLAGRQRSHPFSMERCQPRTRASSSGASKSWSVPRCSYAEAVPSAAQVKHAPRNGNRQSAKSLERLGAPQKARIGRSRCDFDSLLRVATIFEHGSAVMVSGEMGRLRAFAFRTSAQPPCATAHQRREGSQPLERRHLTLSRAGINSGRGAGRSNQIQCLSRTA
jgi:hypothetical protein